MANNGRKKDDTLLLMALAGGASIGAAADATGFGARTIHRRLRDPGFRKRLAELRSEAVGRAVGKLADASSDAAEALQRLLRARSEAVRLGAARAILELGCRLREAEEFAARIAALEAAIEQSAGTADSGEALGVCQ